MTENNNNDNIIEENESKGDVQGQTNDWRARHSVISVIICLFLLGSLASLPGCKDKSDAADSSNANSAAAEEMPAQKDAADSSNANSADNKGWSFDRFYGAFYCVLDAISPVKGSFGEVYPRLILSGEMGRNGSKYKQIIIVTFADILPPDAYASLDISFDRNGFRKYEAVRSMIDDSFSLDLKIPNPHFFAVSNIANTERMQVKFPGGLVSTFNTTGFYEKCIDRLNYF